MKKVFVLIAVLTLLVTAKAFAADTEKQEAAPAAKAEAPAANQVEKVSTFIGYQIGNNVKQETDIKTDADLQEVVKGIKAAMAGEKSPYSIGFSIGSNLKRDLEPKDIDAEALLKGIKMAIASQEPPYNEDQVQEIMTNLRGEIQGRKQAEAEKNKKEGEKFLEDNKNKDGVKSTPSGLQYKIDKEGDGASPTAADSVEVNYRGTLINGKEFDSSYSRGKPATFKVTQVIKGWTEALTMMKPGAKWTLYIPASLAYGEQGSGNNVPANSTLVFEVELLKVTPAPAGAPGGNEGIKMEITPPPGKAMPQQR